MKGYLWIVECKAFSFGSTWEWDSTCFSRKFGRDLLKRHRRMFPDEQFRLVRYVRSSARS